MGAAAVAVAEAAGYYNAGTVEFLLDRDRNFYFLEVNTRIQVEHPVTEMVVGVDLVKEQIRVACGAELSWAQSELSQRGHAVEARIYAEDAAHGFLPAPGPVYFLEEPIGPGLRWDGGVQTGDEVSLYYDPIVAKLIAWGADRTEALGRLRTALNHTVVLGLTTNIEFLKAVLDHPEFISGNLTTSFLQHHIPDWSPSSLSENEMLILAGLTSLASRKSSNGNNNDVSDGQPDPWLTVGAWQVGSGAGR
jgi:acetyl/propionyl-CoA carboxylase alpha subunit